MRRRDALKTLSACLAFAAVGTAAGADEAPYEPLGRVRLAGAKEAVVGPDGKTVFVAATDGFATVDVSDPANPTVLAERRDLLADRENGPLQQIYDAKVEGDRLIVAGPANSLRGDVLQGFLLYDVSDPANPKRLAFHGTDFPIHNCVLRGGTAYLTGKGSENPLVMVDVSDDSPEEVGRWSIVDHEAGWANVDPNLRALHDVWVQDGTAYLAQWDAGVWIVDVSDPANPGFVNRLGGVSLDELRGLGNDEVFATVFEPPGNAHYVTVDETASLLAAGAESSDHRSTPDRGGPSGIDLWDVSDPAGAEKLATIDPPVTEEGGPWTTAHNFDLRDGRLYSSWYGGGVKIHDVSDPANPEEMAWWRGPAEASFWTAKRADGPVVASSAGLRRDAADAAIYTFPDRAGEQADPPALAPVEGTPTVEGSGRGETAADGGRTTTPTAADDGTTVADDGQRGFGALAALSGLAGVALAARRPRRGE